LILADYPGGSGGKDEGERELKKGLAANFRVERTLAELEPHPPNNVEPDWRGHSIDAD